jgi:Tfp pilus assembly protein PilO
MALTGQDIVAWAKKQRIAAASIVVGVVVLGTLYFRAEVRPKLQDEVEGKSAEAERIGVNIKNAAQLPDQLEAMTKATAAINTRLVRVGDLGENLKYFYLIEADTGVKLLELNQTGVVAPPLKGPKPIYSPVAFRFSVRGSYAGVVQFLRRVESGPRFARVLSASMSRSTDLNEPAGTVNLQCNLELLGQP